jgi:hypothetical protein
MIKNKEIQDRLEYIESQLDTLIDWMEDEKIDREIKELFPIAGMV